MAVQATVTKLKASDYEAMGVAPRTLDFSRCNDDDDDTGVYGLFLVQLSTGLDVVVAVVQVCHASMPLIISRARPCMMRLPHYLAGALGQSHSAMYGYDMIQSFVATSVVAQIQPWVWPGGPPGPPHA